MKAFIFAASFALCACTSEQIAQFNQGVVDSIRQALGRNQLPPESQDAKPETVADYPVSPVPAPAPGLMLEPYPASSASIAAQQHHDHPTAKGINPVDDGAIVCQSLDEVNWLFREIGRARVARRYMPPQARELAKLQDGYDPGAEPNPSDYRCQFVPTGTPMTVQWKGGIPVVFGRMSDGRPFAGVTSPQMINR